MDFVLDFGHVPGVEIEWLPSYEDHGDDEVISSRVE